MFLDKFNVLSKIYKEVGPSGMLIITFIIMMLGGGASFALILRAVMEQNKQYTESLLRQHTEIVTEEHNTKYYKNLKRLPVMQQYIKNFVAANNLPEVVVAELHNGESTIKSMPFCKMTVTYDEVNEALIGQIDDANNLFSTHIQSQLISNYPFFLNSIVETMLGANNAKDKVFIFWPQMYSNNRGYAPNEQTFLQRMVKGEQCFDSTTFNTIALHANKTILQHINTALLGKCTVQEFTGADIRTIDLLKVTQNSGIIAKCVVIDNTAVAVVFAPIPFFLDWGSSGNVDKCVDITFDASAHLQLRITTITDIIDNINKLTSNKLFYETFFAN